MDVVVTGLKELQAALLRAETEVDPQTQKVVGFGSNAIKKDWRRRWTGYAHLPHLPRAITYDVDSTGGTITGEIGPERGLLQGRLGIFIAYGTPTSAPIDGPFPAHATEEPKFIRAMGDMAEKLLD